VHNITEKFRFEKKKITDMYLLANLINIVIEIIIALLYMSQFCI